MKTIIITNANEIESRKNSNTLLHDCFANGGGIMDASDGYHTFTELYEHRVTLFIALARHRIDMVTLSNTDAKHGVWRSKQHHIGGGDMYPGWFVMGIRKEHGLQISYHLPIDRWEETDFAETLENAPEWDGHTPADVLKRLKIL